MTAEHALARRAGFIQLGNVYIKADSIAAIQVGRGVVSLVTETGKVYTSEQVSGEDFLNSVFDKIDEVKNGRSYSFGEEQ